MNELYERQLILQQRLAERDRLARKLKTLDKQIVEHETVRKQLLNTFTKEQRDVYDLETFSLVNAWLKLRGTFSEQRTIELEEAARAEFKLREHEAMIDELVLERRDLYETFKAYNGIDVKWEAFIKEKEGHLKQDRDVREALYRLTNQQVETTEAIIEYKEAIAAGKDARAAISKTLKHLDSAKSWSTYDTFFGGGLIATAMKHDAIDASERKMHELQSALERFARELADVKGVVSGLHIERGSLIQFADYFLDDIFSEWTMHGRINDSLDKVNGLDREIAKLIEKMTRDVERMERQLEDMEEKRKQLIITR
ncbi:hypothetical protein EVJ27_11385 [Exiguobacterium sp. SH3S2]|uniref:hypothetical protein n=1 Tax=unclassified Exiguobacterium TaxID=2644629 RepID=UPI001040A8E0|nr:MULTISPECIES: hypothetical protein [unclassified Exiguobacterium]TCI42846.1 hypothetical protein EVJ28_11405 [Exiguobacterium sp. SH3S3]TCI49680.1 hypothetical protein EVJ30_14475 [Exiguobacterium sp. SH5S13]TCI58599.1 hypothetical protein EVJ27_11385 [Exiguobacterium sp. SH3S2]TCI61874.1 hypothetical protein EVJ26_09960 [Exiguobacterium sp. SH3S1]